MAENESKKPKRRLRPAPESLREKAQRTQEAAAQPSRRERATGKVGSGAARVFRPLRVLAKPFRYQPFRFIGKVLKFIGRIVFPSYFRNSWRELRNVTWPDRKQSRQLTFAVLLFALVFGGLVSLVDYGLDKVFKQVLLK